jgi:hypothetical protein
MRAAANERIVEPSSHEVHEGFQPRSRLWSAAIRSAEHPTDEVRIQAPQRGHDTTSFTRHSGAARGVLSPTSLLAAPAIDHGAEAALVLTDLLQHSTRGECRGAHEKGPQRDRGGCGPERLQEPAGSYAGRIGGLRFPTVAGIMPLRNRKKVAPVALSEGAIIDRRKAFQDAPRPRICRGASIAIGQNRSKYYL